MKTPIAATVSLTIVLSGCATASKDISANYVSPMQFQAQVQAENSLKTAQVQSIIFLVDAGNSKIAARQGENKSET